MMLAILSGGGWAAEPVEPWSPESVTQMTDVIENDAGTLAVFQQCPADIFRSKVTFLQRLFPAPGASDAVCAASPEACLSACLQAESGEACFHLAIALYGRREIVPVRYSEILHSRACALGDTAGCTNRAASIRNAPFKGDPFENAGQSVKESCEFRTFSLSCGPGSAWGCAMLGQSYELGEGVAGNRALAEQHYEKACRLAGPTFAACTFAQSRLDRLRRRTP